MTKLTRRELVFVAAAPLIAQTPPSAADTDFYKAALESHKANSAILDQFQIAMSTEPACQFKA
jgi:hypothetical protein